jgi:hypothetical protein
MDTQGAQRQKTARFPARAEIGFLYLYTLKYSMYAALATGLRLTPLNRDRTHVAQFLVRSALELGWVEPAVDVTVTHAPLCIALVILHTKYTGRRQNGLVLRA